MNIRSSFAAVVATISLLSATPAQAALVGVTSLGSLGTVDTFDWSQLGGDFTVLSGSQKVISDGVSTGVVSSAGNVFERRNQGIGWGGNFTPPMALLWTQGVGPDITFTPTNPVAGFGAQIQTDVYGAFTAEVTAYDNTNAILGVFSEAGVSDGNSDGSAIFIGLQGTTSNIAKLKFIITQATAGLGDFAIGSLYVNANRISDVPLPAGLLLFGTAILALGAFSLRRRNAMSVA